MAEDLRPGAVNTSWYCLFFNDTATTEIYTLSLRDALPISGEPEPSALEQRPELLLRSLPPAGHQHHLDVDHLPEVGLIRSEEHTSELQSRQYLVCRLLLEKTNIWIDMYSSSDAFDHGECAL